MDEYWNHNTAYHRWLLDIAARQRGDVLDVGCGDGLLLQRLSPVSRNIVGVEPDPATAQRAQQRLYPIANASVAFSDFEGFAVADESFDVITFVASIHHQPLREALTKAHRLLRPGGELAVVGLARNESVLDWTWSLLCLPVVKGRSRVAPGNSGHRCADCRTSREPHRNS